MENVKINPTIQKHRVNQAGVCEVQLTIYLNRKIVAYDHLHKKVKPTDWDDDIRECKKNEELNALIRKRAAELDKEFTRHQLRGDRLTKESIRKIIKGDQFACSFFEYAANLIETKKLKDGHPYSPDSKRRYGDEIKRMQAYKPSLLFSQVTHDFIINYKEWMQTIYRKKDKTLLHKNSIWKALSFVRMVCNEAIEEGLMLKENYPFKKFEIGKCETDPSKIKYLDLDQVESIEKILVEKSHLISELTVRIGWRFLTMCVFGMRISDAMRLNSAFLNDAGNLDFVPYKTRRSGNIAQVPIISDRQRRYLEKALSMPLPDCDPKIYRKIFNDHLKILSAIAGVTTHITSHVGRHTMGSFMVDANISDHAAKAMLGVKSNNTMKVYSHLKQSKLISEANKLNNIF